MPLTSHRRAEGRNFDCIYDPNFIVASEKEIEEANELALKNSATLQIQPKYSAMFENAPKAKRLIYHRKQLNDLPNNGNNQNGQRRANSREVVVQGIHRLKGGANNPAERKFEDVVYSPSECKKAPSGLNYFKPKTNVNVINVKLSNSKTNQQSTSKIKEQKYKYCQFFNDEKKRKRNKTRGTQTLYRESSAQTLPYLPDVSNKENELHRLELFKLPSILPGSQPPGLYEVEVLERSRKRWAFSEALKENFKRQLEEAREHVKLSKHKHILEAFEWEYWIEREEYIQECQMMRLDLLIQMFDKREKEMHDASNMRLQISYERISANREAALRKNEVVYQRQIRLLNMKKAKVPRNWRKENIVRQFGSPSSEFYGPQQRYGVNPNRRHFTGKKAFEERMDDLEKRAVNMKKLVCPFAKLKEWSKPKGRIREVEQNFCAEENLRKMYESLTGLRLQSSKQKTVPKCLLGKIPQKTYPEYAYKATVAEEIIAEAEKVIIEDVIEGEEEKLLLNRDKEKKEAKSKKERLLHLLHENDNEELEAMLYDYEGSTIGWLMRFLSEEMSRLQEQRVLHFITMLAQKERWRREAAEAGLRQKENEMRQIYEQLYDQTNAADTDISKEYLENILSVDTREYADDHATDSIISLAKTIDKDIQRWLDSFTDIQNPLNFDSLRYTMKDIIFPDLEKILKQKENVAVSKYIIDSVLIPNVYKLLEPYDIAFPIANATIDSLIDTDLYTISPDCSECFCTLCECVPEKNEAKAILRKAIRYAVPGRRWMTSVERIAYENAMDIVQVALDRAQVRGSLSESLQPVNLCRLQSAESHIDLLHKECGVDARKESEESTDSEYMPLITEEKLLLDDTAVRHDSKSIIISTAEEEISSDHTSAQPNSLKKIISAFDIMSKAGDLDFSNSYGSSSSSLTDIGVNFSVPRESREDETKATRRFLHVLIKEIVGNFVPAESGDDKTSTECEESLQSLEVEEDENDPNYILKAILRNVLDYIPDDFGEEEFNYETEEASFEQMEEFDGEEEQLKLILSESEIEAMESERCKCEAEIIREKYIRQMLDEGRAKIVTRAQKMERDKLTEAEEGKEKEEEAKEEWEDQVATEILAAITSFEYISDGSVPSNVTEPEDYELRESESAENKTKVKLRKKFKSTRMSKTPTDEELEKSQPAKIKMPFKLDVECSLQHCKGEQDEKSTNFEEMYEETDSEFKDEMSTSDHDDDDDFQTYIRMQKKKQKAADLAEERERVMRQKELEEAGLILPTTVNAIEENSVSFNMVEKEKELKFNSIVSHIDSKLGLQQPGSEESDKTVQQAASVLQAETVQPESVQQMEFVKPSEHVLSAESVHEAASVHQAETVNAEETVQQVEILRPLASAPASVDPAEPPQ